MVSKYLRKRLEAGTPPVRQPYPDLDENTLEHLTREIQGSNGDPAITAHTHVAQPAPTDTPRKAVSVSPETSARYRVRLSRARSTSQPTQTVQDIDRNSGSGSDGVADNHVSTTNEIQDATHDPFAGPHIMSPRLERHHYSSNESANVSTNSLHLTEVKDNPSHTHAMNAVQLCFNEGQTSFRDIGRSPINDTSSLISELSETATSQRSSSAPSFFDPNVTMHNVEIGSPPQVMPPVIRHNSDNHFSGYHAVPVESIDDRIRRLTPPQFMPLIDQLLWSRSRGNMKPRRTIVAKALVQYDPDVYRRAGVTDFWDYATQAGKAFLNELGGWWIALHPNLFEATYTPTISAVDRPAFAGEIEWSS